MNTIYRNKKWLYKKYVSEKMSTRNIGKLVNIDNKVIWYWLKKYNISCRYRPIIPDKGWLENKYIKEKLSFLQIAKLYNVSLSTISNWLKRYHITPRLSGEGVHFRKVNFCNLSIEAISWLYGELLGDGCLQSRYFNSARISYSSKYKEYIEYISDTLKLFGVKQSGRIRKKHLTDRGMDCYSYQYNSLAYSELSVIYKKWYPEGKKVVPKDIELTPLTLRQWYIGDGCLIHPRGSKPYISLATNGFPISNVGWLVEQLSKLDFKAIKTTQNSIRMLVCSTEKFLNYIGKCPVECYQYKWLL